jgi:diacylglycerol kinase (ATP)
MKHDKRQSDPAVVLVQAREQYAKRLRKIEKARARLAKASHKLHAAEAELAQLVNMQTRALSLAPERSNRPRRARRQAHLLFNPRSKAVRDGAISLEQIVDCLGAYGFEITIGLKTSGDVARHFVRQAREQHSDLVIVAAGDGTIEDVAGELVDSDTALGILPIGTMNNLARCLGVPLDLEAACKLLCMGTTRHIDAGRVKTPAKPKGVCFLETAGVGLSALAAPIGQDAEKGRWGLLLQSLGKALSFTGTQIAIAYDDGEVIASDTQVVTVSNAPMFGKHMLIVPDAKLDDGLLDLALYSGMGKLELERHFMAIADGQRPDDPQVVFRQARRVRITTEKPLEANADMHILANQQAWEIEALAGALSVVAGNGFALTLPVTSAPPAPPLDGRQPPAPVAEPAPQA